MSGACAELRCFCLASVSRPGLAFRVCCECPDCVFAAARIASLVQLNFVGVETDARHNPRNSCRSRLYIEFVPQPFRLKAQTHRLFCSAGSGCCKLVAQFVERRSVVALCGTGSREKGVVVALLVAVWLSSCLAKRGRAGVRTLSHISLCRPDRPDRVVLAVREEKTVRRENSFLRDQDTSANLCAPLLGRPWHCSR